MKKGFFQLQYELDQPYTEAGSDRGAKLTQNDALDPEVWQVLKATENMGYKGTLKYLTDRQAEPEGKILVVPITTRTPEAMRYRLEGVKPKLIYL